MIKKLSPKVNVFPVIHQLLLEPTIDDSGDSSLPDVNITRRVTKKCVVQLPIVHAVFLMNVSCFHHNLTAG